MGRAGGRKARAAAGAGTPALTHLPRPPILHPQNVKGALVVGILMITFISWIPSDGNSARYIQKPDGCQPSGTNSNTGEPCTYTPAMRRWDYFAKVRPVCVRGCVACGEGPSTAGAGGGTRMARLRAAAAATHRRHGAIVHTGCGRSQHLCHCRQV